MGLEVDNYIDELVEDHCQELVTEELTELHCISEQKVVEESSSKEEEVTAKQQSSGSTREMLKAWRTVASLIEKHHPNKAVAMRTTNLFHYREILKRQKKQNVYRQISSKIKN
ncbi:hypothetical protein AVEN_127888-1 [Araneus ventricosus]|uniref:Uncharacterized protein n=1 Tax=Araneus ventricosus TaxID=182803 RepID=A0A4Y1ZYQ4_ARAVE|nr:hypothetical protein AVEN_127888-1 [Araneus ventricosus]